MISEERIKEFKDGELITRVDAPSTYLTLEIFELELTAAQLTAWVKFEGGPDAMIGYYCQSYLDEDQITYQYEFLIARDGNFSLEYQSINKDGDKTGIELLSEGSTTALHAQGSELYNSLQAFCEEDHLLFFANGELLVDVFSSRPVIAGTVGLVIGNGPEADNVQATWDMLTVSEP